jgi:hypothetical protein
VRTRGDRDMGVMGDVAMATSWLNRFLGGGGKATGASKSPARGPTTPHPRTAAGGPTSPAAGKPTAFAAVAVLPGPKCCAAVRKLEGSTWLAREAPRLPLIDCQNPADCHCRFHKLADRRIHEQRATYVNWSGLSYSGVEKRRSGGRRKRDK